MIYLRWQKIVNIISLTNFVQKGAENGKRRPQGSMAPGS